MVQGPKILFAALIDRCAWGGDSFANIRGIVGSLVQFHFKLSELLVDFLFFILTIFSEMGFSSAEGDRRNRMPMGRF